jgi:hypothetical protein
MHKHRWNFFLSFFECIEYVYTLQIVCEFGINVVCMFIVRHRHCTQLNVFFDYIVHKHTWISIDLLSLSAFECMHIL